MAAASHRTATSDDSGRTCPYCRFPLKVGAEVDGCGECHAVHHADCWQEGGGCAVVGCAGAASAPAAPPPDRGGSEAPTAVLPTFAAPSDPVPSWPAPPPPAQPRPAE
ncbi:RING finger protein, partial [Patulibacter sp. NPDC049589]|uniref:RING finger protein n=1 Tax=Patulibacter sp. NPDC049589 TaxID=3154731 RepID=UPI003419739E